MYKVFLIVLPVFFLTACSKYASNGESLYLKSRNGVNLTVPPTLFSDNISHFYDLPAQDQKADVSIDPPELQGN